MEEEGKARIRVISWKKIGWRVERAGGGRQKRGKPVFVLSGKRGTT